MIREPISTQVRISGVEHPLAGPLERDVLAFGTQPALALADLPDETAQLNRVYLQCLADRSLQVLPDLEQWYGYPVRVFLRHDTVFVFAISLRSWVGMANRVELTSVRFCVDEHGRRQTLAKNGPLQNRSTVHAWLQGSLRRLSGDAPADLEKSNPACLPDQGWQPVVYRPDTCQQFVLADSGQPITEAAEVIMVPGKQKVWVRQAPRPVDLRGHHRSEPQEPRR